jgi:hypothetical protein
MSHVTSSHLFSLETILISVYWILHEFRHLTVESWCGFPKRHVPDAFVNRASSPLGHIAWSPRQPFVLTYFAAV